MFTKSRATVFSVGIVFFLSVLNPAGVWADPSCPLNNPAYTDIRSAALALETLLDLPKECEAQAEQFRSANKQIADNARNVSHLLISPPKNLADLTLADRASIEAVVAGLFRIASLYTSYAGQAGSGEGSLLPITIPGFGDSNARKCGKALLSATDYLLGFVDTVNSISPLLVALGGSNGLTGALGVNVLSAAVRTFVVFFQGLKVDMSTADARRAFIENACLYYQFDESLRSLLQAIRGGPSDLEKKVQDLEKELQDGEAAAPALPLPEERIRELAELQQRETRFLKDFSELFERIGASAGAIPCGLVGAQVEASLKDGGFPISVVGALEELLGMPDRLGIAPGPVLTLIAQFRRIHEPSLYVGDSPQDAGCASRSREWFATVYELLKQLDLELRLPGRLDLSDTPQGKARAAWLKKQQDLSVRLSLEKAKLEALRALAGQGADVDLSELLETKDRVRKSLFGSTHDRKFFWIFRKKGPAECWLEQKQEGIVAHLAEYKSHLLLAGAMNLDEIQKPSAPLHLEHMSCSLGAEALLDWENAQRHGVAAQLFCTTFDKTITPSMHPHVAQHCVGKFNRKNEKTREAKLKIRRDEIDSERPRVEAIRSWMSSNSCGSDGGRSSGFIRTVVDTAIW